MKYYIKVNNSEYGPYSAQQIYDFGISANTTIRVATDGDDGWVKGSELVELMSLLEVLKKDSEFNPDAFFTNDTTPLSEKIHDDPMREKPDSPPTYLIASIIAIVVFLPTGIAALIKSSLIENRYSAGRYADALWLSRSCRGFCILSYTVGAIFWILVSIISYAK